MAEGAAVVRVGAKAAGPLRRRLFPETSDPALARHADELAGKVRRRERELRAQLSAAPSDVIAVEITVDAKAVDGAVQVTGLTEHVRSLPEPRRVLIHGEAGSGKTVAATYLTLGLLDHRDEVADFPRANVAVPVRVNAAGWNGRQHFSRWLIERLGSDYGLLPRVAKALVESERILPLIDGLDEMDSVEAAYEALRKLSREPWKGRQLVVLCRTEDFEDLRRHAADARLASAATMEMRPLTHRQTIGYLASQQAKDHVPDDAWTDVIDRIEHAPTGPLATALRTPWMLALAVVAQQHDAGIGTKLTRFDDADAIRNQLLATQVRAAVAGTNPEGEFEDYTEANVTQWLATLAHRLDDRATAGQDGTTMQLDEVWELAGPIRCRVLYSLVCGLIALLGLVLSFLAPAPEGPTWLDAAVWTWLPLLAFPLAVMVVTSGPADVQARRLAWRRPGRAWRHVVARLTEPIAIALCVAVICAVAVVFGGMTGRDALTIAALAAPGCLAYGLVNVLSVDSDEMYELVMHETRLLRDDATAAVVIGGLTAASIWGGVVGADRLGGEPDGSLLTPLYTAGYLGLIVTLLYGVATGRYLTAMALFAMTGSFPDRPARFLDWARRGGLLGVSYAAYQFRHETFREWVKANAPRPPDTRPAPNAVRARAERWMSAIRDRVRRAA